MKNCEPRFLSLGDTALTVEFGRSIERPLFARVIGLRQAIEAERAAGGLSGIIETVPAFRSLTVHYDPLILGQEALVGQLRAVLATAGTETVSGRRWQVPACFDEALAPDLGYVAEQSGLAAETVVADLAGTDFLVYMLGFLPGFPYMGGLPGRLSLPRRAEPRLKVPARSIAIANEMCAIYPVISPGGWHLVGQIPIEIFDPASTPPALLAPGDTVRFLPVDRAEFDALRRDATDGRFRLVPKPTQPDESEAPP
ncbi:MAG: 5-oxoprolinase subunit PxpB [Azospirillum sp.]|nr:5-oxoprolinase subunit PxpB [Azospirillum sp.]